MNNSRVVNRKIAEKHLYKLLDITNNVNQEDEILERLESYVVDIANQSNFEFESLAHDDAAVIHHIVYRMSADLSKYLYVPDADITSVELHNLKNEMRQLIGGIFKIKIKDKHLNTGNYVEL